jgi:hypothetical protein
MVLFELSIEMDPIKSYPKYDRIINLSFSKIFSAFKNSSCFFLSQPSDTRLSKNGCNPSMLMNFFSTNGKFNAIGIAEFELI